MRALDRGRVGECYVLGGEIATLDAAYRAVAQATGRRLPSIVIPDGLLRAIGLWPAVMLVVGNVIGSAIFLTPGSIAETLPSVPLVLIAWLAGGVLGVLLMAAVGSNLLYYHVNHGHRRDWRQAFQRVEKKLFTPMAYTIGYALAALLLFLTKKSDPLLQSTDRYVLAVFPAFASWSLLLRRQLVLTVSLVSLFLLNLILLWAFFDWALVV